MSFQNNEGRQLLTIIHRKRSTVNNPSLVLDQYVKWPGWVLHLHFIGIGDYCFADGKMMLGLRITVLVMVK